MSERVLGAILPDRRDLLLYTLTHLEAEHFRETIEQRIFEMLDRYFDVAADVLPESILNDMLSRSKVDEAKQLLYEQKFASLIELEVPDHEFKYAIEALKEKRAEVLTGEVITQAYEILERGVEVDGQKKEGHQNAREYLYGELSVIDRLNHVKAAPEGDMRSEAKEVLSEYADRKAGELRSGVLSGIPPLDAVTGGFQNGELCLLCAYTGQGKSQMCAQIAWDVSIMQGKNVFFGTSETVRRTVRRRIIARHSRHPFFGLPEGLNVRDLRDGTLDEKQEEVFQAVVEDLRSNEAYGKIYIAQIPRGATLGFLESRMRRQADQWHIDLALFDYLPLLQVDKRRDTKREEFNDLIQEAKVMATSFYDGQGVPFISPWQMQQIAWKNAKETLRYELANLSDTSEAEKSADQIISLLRGWDGQKPHAAKMQLLKNRDGEPLDPFDVRVDYRNAYIGEADEEDNNEDDKWGLLG